MGSFENSMQEPARSLLVPVVKAVAIKPETAAFTILHPIIIPCVLTVPAPPFGRDPLRPLRACNPVGDPPPTKYAWRSLGHLGDNVDRFR